MKVTFNELASVPIEDRTKFNVASALLSYYFSEHLSTIITYSGGGVDAWIKMYKEFDSWIVEYCPQSAIMLVGGTQSNVSEHVANMFMFYIVVTTEGALEKLKGMANNQSITIRNNHTEIMYWLLRGRDNLIGKLYTEVLGDKMSLDRKNIPYLFSCVIVHQLGALFDGFKSSLEDVNKESGKQKRKIVSLESKIVSLEKNLADARNKPPVIKEIKVQDTEREDALYAELQTALTKVTLLEDKLAVYEATTSADDYAVMEELYNEEQEDFDISNYKILIIGSEENSEAYPFPYIECQSNTKILSKIDYVDFVLFDTRANSHHTYYSVKNKCRSAGVKMLHINNRNKNAILSEAKRLIKMCI